MGNTIVALATAPLKCALHLIRVSGDDAFLITDQLFSKKISGLQKRSVFLGNIRDKGEDIDNVVVIAYPAPHTMTGEDVVEITCHGSVLIANEIIASYLSRGARYATRGEFSMRAFYNGKMDLIEAEAVNDMINATTKEAKNLSLMSLLGKTSALIAPLKKSLADLLALVEVNIDYPEYTDIEEANVTTIAAAISPIREEVQKLIKGGEEGIIIRQGIKVAIVGEPNVGKSSLLNALLHEDKAIVSDIPGTTRDVVEGDINLKGVALHLLDTAGIREEGDRLENLGIKKSQQMIEEADLVIVLLDASKGVTENDEKILSLTKNKKTIVAYNKSDKTTKKDKDKLYISAIHGQIQPLLDEIFAKLGLSSDSYSNPSLSNARELGLLKKIDLCLAQAQEDCRNELPIDLISVNLSASYNAARELLGEEVTTDLTDEIFSRFCVGK